MFRDKAKALIPDGWKLLGDQLYRVDEEGNWIAVVNAHDDPEIKLWKARALSRHETINKRLADYGVLRQIFRHTKDKQEAHKQCFEACAVLVQYQIGIDEPLFQV